MDFYLSAIIQGLCFSGLALGIYLSMKVFNIPDITTDGSYTLGGAITAVMLSNDVPSAFILIPVVLAGACAGAATGIIHTRLKVNPLLAGILVMSALYSVNLVIMGRSNLPLMHTNDLFKQAEVLANPTGNTFLVAVLFALFLAGIVGYLLRTDFGIAMRATGGSESMVRALGVNTGRMKITGLAIANALTASAGYLMTQFQGFADINMGIGIVITGLGAVVIGDMLITRFRIRRVFLSLLFILSGAIVFQLALAFSLTMGADPAFLKLITAGSVLLLIAITRISLKQAV